MSYTVFAKFVVLEGREAEFIAAFGEMWEQTRSEPGTLHYALNRSTQNPAVFWVSEIYDQRSSFKAHAASEAMSRLMTAIEPLARKSEQEFLMGELVDQM